MPSFIEKRRRRYYAVLDIPKALQPTFKRRRFVRSLQTESLTVAERNAMPLIYEWKKLIEAARGGANQDSLIWKINEVRLHADELKRSGETDESIAELHEDLALTLGSDFDEHGNVIYDDELFEATQVVHRDQIYLVEHIDDYLSSLDLQPKTIDARRKSLVEFSQKFRFITDVKPRSVKHWLNVEIAEGEKKAHSTVSRIATDCNQYWEYLQLHHNVDATSPFIKALPKRKTRKSKAAIKAKRKAFRVDDYQKLYQAASERGDDTLADLINLAAHTGCRIEELCSLKLVNVQEDRIVITDAKTEAGWRDIPIHEDINQTVRKLVNTAAGEYLISGLSFNKYGDRSNAIGKRFGRLKTRLGFGSDYVFHSFRRAFSTQLENAGIERTTVARLMGHELGDETFGGYSDGLIFDRLKQAVSQIQY